jgi:predicted transcriptional regulator
MPRPTFLPELSGNELDVMKILWDAGKLAAREVHETLAERTGWSYSTTRTVLDRMVAKGLVDRHSFHGLYLYQAAISRPRGLARQVQHFAERVLGTDWAPVVSLFAESQALSEEEIEELSRLLTEDQSEGGPG